MHREFSDNKAFWIGCLGTKSKTCTFDRLVQGHRLVFTEFLERDGLSDVNPDAFYGNL